MISVSLAATASRSDANAADGGTSAVDGAPSADAPSAFQALFAPTLAGGDAALASAASSADSGLGLESPLASSLADAAAAADADGNPLPLGVSPLAWLVAAAAIPAGGADTAAASATAGATRQGAGRMPSAAALLDQADLLPASTLAANADLERFNSGPHRLPGLDPNGNVPALPLPALAQAGNPSVAGDNSAGAPVLPNVPADSDAVPADMLERFNSGPHRLPPNAGAAFTFAQALRLGERGSRVANASLLDGTRRAVDSGLNPAPAIASANTLSTLAAAPSGFAQTPGTAAWGQALDQQVLLMMQRGSQQARIRLHPQELGQLDIRLSMGGDRVDLNFSVQHAAVAGALQQHMPQLTQMLADQGLALGHASVSHEQAQSGGTAGQGGSSQHGNAVLAMNADAEIDIQQLRYQPTARGVLDLFA